VAVIIMFGVMISCNLQGCDKIVTLEKRLTILFENIW